MVSQQIFYWPGKSASSLALVRTKYNVDFFLFGAVRFHSALFASEPEIVNKTTRVLRSSIHWFIHSTVLEFVWNRTETTSSAGSQVWLFGPHLSAIAVFTPAQKIHTKGGNEFEFDSIEPNKTCEYTLSNFSSTSTYSTNPKPNLTVY